MWRNDILAAGWLCISRRDPVPNGEQSNTFGSGKGLLIHFSNILKLRFSHAEFRI